MPAVEHPNSAITDPQRLAALDETELLDSPPEVAFDRLISLASKILGTPVSLVSLVSGERQFFKSQVGLPEPWASQRQTPLSHSFCQHVVTSHEPLVISNAREHPLVRENLAVDDLGVVAYAGIPLTTPDGQTLGSFCAIDSKPRQWTEQELEILRDLAASAMTEIELRLTAKRLQQNYQKLRQLEAMRDDLTDMIVHDLRTPLTAVLSGIQTLPLLGELDAEQQEVLEMSLESGSLMLNLISDLLDISRVESGNLGLAQNTVVVTELVESGVRQVGALAADKQLQLNTHIEPELPDVIADKDKLLRVLVNLLSNAIKFTPPQGTITVEVCQQARKQRLEDEAPLLFVVSDTGEGIPTHALERIFDKFGQVENRKAGRRNSSGVGLTFCRLVVEAHGGQIWVESETGQGSQFFFTIPLSAASLRSDFTGQGDKGDQKRK